MSGSLFRRIGKTIICVALGAFILFNSPVVSRAYDDTVSISEDTYNTLTKGTRVYNGVDYGAKYGYNPLYYFLNYNDLRIAYGADPAKLVEHYALFGIKENRVANRQITRGAHSWGSSNEYIVPSNQLTSNQSNGMTVIPEQLHNNGGMNKRQDVEARSVAKQLADSIYEIVMLANNPEDSNKNSSSSSSSKEEKKPVINEIQMVAYATGVVQAYCKAGTELTREEVAASNSKVYRTAYGVFCAHEFTSAGATRALGLILDYLDADIHRDYPDAPPIKWVHVNANTWNLQFCQIACNNHEAYADAINGIAGYGKHPTQGGVEKDIQSYVSVATLTQIINTRPPFADDGLYSTQDLPKNTNPMTGTANDYKW